MEYTKLETKDKNLAMELFSEILEESNNQIHRIYVSKSDDSETHYIEVEPDTKRFDDGGNAIRS